MKRSYTIIMLCCMFVSCITTTHIHYSDPNYLASDEFSSYEDITKIVESNNVDILDTVPDYTEEDYYNADDYYDYSYSSRIRRFHRPMFYSNFYGSIYTDYYWYNHDPFYCGTSIYYGYNWHSPYYSYYSYSPYYYHNFYTPYFYTPYFYGNYYGYYGYGHNHYLGVYNTYYQNTYDNNSYSTGPRGSLSTTGINRGIKTNAIISNSNINQNNSILNIRNKFNNKNNINTNIKSTATNNKPIIKDKNLNNRSINKTDYKKTNYKQTEHKKNNSYSTKKNNSYNYQKSNNTNRSTKNNKKRKNIKPR